MKRKNEDELIIYGAGKRGKSIYRYLMSKNMGDRVKGFCDTYAADNLKEIEGKRCFSFAQAKQFEIPFLISATGDSFVEIQKILEKEHCIYLGLNELADILGMDRVEFGREYCAFHHIDDLDGYYESSENQLDIFWGEHSEFNRLFSKLNKKSIVEVACGRGRHVPYYIEPDIKVVLVDILDQNIRFCKERFQKYVNIEYYCNNGYNLQNLKTEEYTAVFSYDAMVHFEMMDIYEYLKDIYRILRKDGMALIHHSNLDWNYRASFAETVRNFMSKNIFAHMAYQIGFEIVEQRIIDWGGCFTIGLHFIG